MSMRGKDPMRKKKKKKCWYEGAMRKSARKTCACGKSERTPRYAFHAHRDACRESSRVQRTRAGCALRASTSRAARMRCDARTIDFRF